MSVQTKGRSDFNGIHQNGSRKGGSDGYVAAKDMNPRK
jgi:hypothetical protein